MSEPEPRNPASLERALEQARQALSDGDATPQQKGLLQRAGDEVVKKAGVEAGKVLQQFPEGSPARVTRTFAHVLDELIRVPGTKIRFGVDPLLSLVPWAGTTVAALFGTVVLVDSVRLRAPLSVLARMVGNYVIDWLLGLIPFVGAFLDMAWRSNAKNLKLLNRTIEDRDHVRRSSATYWICVAGLAATVLLVILAVPVGLLLWLNGVITGG